MIPLEEWYYEIPIISRTYITLVVACTLAVQLDLVQTFQLHFSYDLVFKGHQYWRLLTTFLYFGDLSINFVFHMFFLVRYCRTLEEGYFRGRTVDFAWMFFLSMVAIVVITPIVSPKANSLPFLSSPLMFVLVYLWSRKNPHMRMAFFGLFVIGASYLPWVYIGFSLIIHGVWPTGDLIGLIVGHTYYFLDEIWPRGGGAIVGGVRMDRPKIVRAPQFLKHLVGMEFVGGRSATNGIEVNIPGHDAPVEEGQPHERNYEVWNPDGPDEDRRADGQNELRQRQIYGNDANDER